MLQLVFGICYNGPCAHLLQTGHAHLLQTGHAHLLQLVPAHLLQRFLRIYYKLVPAHRVA